MSIYDYNTGSVDCCGIIQPGNSYPMSNNGFPIGNVGHGWNNMPANNLPICNYVLNVNSVLAENHALHEQIWAMGLKKQRQQKPREFKQDTATGWHFCEERNGHMSPIGTIEIKKCIFINAIENDVFDSLIVKYTIDGSKFHMTNPIPYKDFINQKLMRYFTSFVKHADCSDKICNELLYLLVIKCNSNSTLKIPCCTGWNITDKNAVYITGSNYKGSPYTLCIPDELKRYRLEHTSRTIEEVAADYQKLVPNHWIYTFLLVFRASSLLLSLYANEGLELKQTLIVETTTSQETELAISMLKTFNRPSMDTISLNGGKSRILQELRNINDGTIILRDTSLIDDEKKLRESLVPIVNDLQNTNGEERHHGIVLLSRYASKLMPSDLVCRFSMEGVPCVEDNAKLQRIMEEMDSILTGGTAICLQSVKGIIKTYSKEVQQKLLSEKPFALLHNTIKILLTTQVILEYIFNIDFKLEHMLYGFDCIFPDNTEECFDAAQAITNDFSKVINSMLEQGKLTLKRKTPDTVFNKGEPNVLVMDDKLCLESTLIDKMILPAMHTTKSRDKLISALKDCGYLYATNKNQHPIHVYDEHGNSVMLHSYSVTLELLNSDNRYKVNNLESMDFILKASEPQPEDFLPLLTTPNNEIIGRTEHYEDKENNHIYVTGQSGYGKSYFLSQLICHSAKLGHKVVIFDSSDSFEYGELCRNLSKDFVDKHITYHRLEKDGVPVDLFNLNGCNTLPERKNTLSGVLSAAAGDLSKVQLTTLKKSISDLLSVLDSGEKVTLDNILTFLEENSNTQKSLKTRFSSVFDDISNCGMSDNTWEQFFAESKEVVLISTQTAFTEHGDQLIDMLLATLYNYQLCGAENQLDIVIDEMQTQNVSDGSPIYKILKEGRKYHIAFIGATQSFYQKHDPVGKVMNHAETMIFLKPKTDSEKDAANVLGLTQKEMRKFRMMDRGDCFVSGKFYNKAEGCNRPAVLYGKVFSAI